MPMWHADAWHGTCRCLGVGTCLSTLRREQQRPVTMVPRCLAQQRPDEPSPQPHPLPLGCALPTLQQVVRTNVLGTFSLLSLVLC